MCARGVVLVDLDVDRESYRAAVGYLADDLIGAARDVVKRNLSGVLVVGLRRKDGRSDSSSRRNVGRRLARPDGESSLDPQAATATTRARSTTPTIHAMRERPRNFGSSSVFSSGRSELAVGAGGWRQCPWLWLGRYHFPSEAIHHPGPADSSLRARPWHSSRTPASQSATTASRPTSSNGSPAHSRSTDRSAGTTHNLWRRRCGDWRGSRRSLI